MSEEIFEELANAVINCKADLSKAAAQKALDAGVNPVEAINEGLVKGMNVIGDKYAAHQIYLPQVLVAAHAMYAGLDLLLPAIPKEDLADAKKAATCVVEGDVHDIGKNIVKTMLTAGGYIVNDLGKDVPPATIADTVKNEGIPHHGQHEEHHRPPEGAGNPRKLHRHHRRTTHIPQLRGGDRRGPQGQQRPGLRQLAQGTVI